MLDCGRVCVACGCKHIIGSHCDFSKLCSGYLSKNTWLLVSVWWLTAKSLILCKTQFTLVLTCISLCTVNVKIESRVILHIMLTGFIVLVCAMQASAFGPPSTLNKNSSSWNQLSYHLYDANGSATIGWRMSASKCTYQGAPGIKGTFHSKDQVSPGRRRSLGRMGLCL